MEQLMVLAQVTNHTGAAYSATPFVPVDSIWEQITALTWLQAVLAISFGVVYLLYGWRIFKILVVISFGLVGLFAGIRLGTQHNMEILGGLVGFCLMAVVSIPLMKWAVSLLGAIAGGILTGGLWYAFELPGKYIIAGAAIGIIAGGMISFIVFKIAVMLFTSLGGSSLIVSGMLSLLYHYELYCYRYQDNQEAFQDRIRDLVYNHNWFLPVVLLVPTIIGIIVQNRLIKGSRDWNI